VPTHDSYEEREIDAIKNTSPQPARVGFVGRRRSVVRHSLPTGDANAQTFDDFARRYDRRDEINGGWITDWLRGVLAGRHGASALDLGCGTGRVALLLAEHYDSVRAVDLSQEMVELAQAKRPHPRITYEQSDLREVTGSYDLVVSIMVLHHLPDPAVTLGHLANLVAPGGMAVLIDAAQPPTSRWRLHFWDLAGFARDVKQAFEKLQLNSDRRWVDHLLSDRFLQPVEFVLTYSRALPGVAIEPVGGLCTAVWQRSSQDSESPAILVSMEQRARFTDLKTEVGDVDPGNPAKGTPRTAVP